MFIRDDQRDFSEKFISRDDESIKKDDNKKVIYQEKSPVVAVAFI